MILELTLLFTLFLVLTSLLYYTTVWFHEIAPMKPISKSALTIAGNCTRRVRYLLHSTLHSY